MKKKAILVVALLAIGMASALLVSYLSNKSTATVEVTSPILNEIEGDDSFNIVGGEVVSFNATTTNMANIPITGTLTNQFANTLGMNCSDFSALSVENFINNTSTGVTDVLVSGCSIVDNNTVSIVVGTQPKTWAGNEIEKNVFNVTFQLNAIGTYTFTSQVMI